jgi:hypothetical protein
MVKHYVLTLDGNAQRLSSLIADQQPHGAHDTPLRAISLQPGPANANAVFLGGAAVSATDFGVRLEASAAGVPPAPFILGEFDEGGMRLSDFYVIGTATEKLHVLVVTYGS